jgi:putative SOS response-associated peptidase YedK
VCGRFILTTPGEILHELFHLVDLPRLEPRYNIAPSQEIAAVRIDPGATAACLDELRWGLIPYWAEDARIGYRMINARSETVATKPAFREAVKSRRCLIPTDGFFEWRKEGSLKQPYLFRPVDGAPVAFAGLWDRWRKPGGEYVESCTILTCPPNKLVAPFHDRMPVILSPRDYMRWLDPAIHAVDELDDLFVAFDANAMERIAVSPRVNSVANDDPRCIEPSMTQGTLF